MYVCIDVILSLTYPIVAVDFSLTHTNNTLSTHILIYSNIIQTLRVVVQQGTLIMGNFMTEQLETDIKRKEDVDNGTITPAEAEIMADEWEKVRFCF